MSKPLKSVPMNINLQVVGDLNDREAERLRRALESYAATLMYVRGAQVTLPEPESPVSYSPCLMGKVEIEGAVSEFMIPLENDSVGFSQWGAPNETLWERVALLDNLSGPAREWWADNKPAEEDDDA